MRKPQNSAILARALDPAALALVEQLTHRPIRPSITAIEPLADPNPKSFAAPPPLHGAAGQIGAQIEHQGDISTL